MKSDSPLILIVEDNPADAALIAEELRPAIERGVFTLCNATTMAEARRQLDERDIAAVLLDLSLPDSHGMDTFEEALAHSPDTPIVVLTGLDDGELGLKAVRQGAQDFLVKGKIDAVTLERTLHYSVERKRRETEERQRQSLEVMSQFADGIAQEFNNLLQTVLGRLQALEWPLRDNDALLGEVRAASETVLGGAAVTRRLLSVTGRLPDEPALLDANAHIAKLSDSLRKAFGESTSIRTELCDGAWPVFADPAQLDMTVLNIVNNARDAMLGRGAVTLRTSNFTIGEPNPAELPAGDYVMIEITDIGEGISAVAQKRIFDPLYSTRGDSRLKGLGLSMTRNFVRESGGHIGVRSAAGEGTTVTLYLPRAEEEHGASTPSDARPVAEARKDNVMVLEEDAALRESLVRYLWQLGYPTYEASNAGDGFALLDGPDKISLLIVDRRGVEGAPGHLLAREMRKVSPRLKILFLTNAETEQLAPHGLPSDVVASLAKPFTIDAIERQVGELLHNPRPAA